jgi:hypothetical protein
MNQPYDIARYQFVTGAFNWTTMNLLLIAWAGPPTFVPTDQNTGDIATRGTTTARGTSQPITQKTVAANGTTQTNQVVIPAVPIGTPITHFTLVNDQGAIKTLLYYIDEAIDLPFDPNGLDMLIQPDWLTQRGWFRA